ncbi:MAG: hypothetical protein K2X32_09275 [Phycisphaerales bacterium]|nr:hypothetical protein [Phycisphaerales bacterium]
MYNSDLDPEEATTPSTEDARAQTPQGQYWTPEFYEKDRLANNKKFGDPTEAEDSSKSPAADPGVPMPRDQPYQRQSEEGLPGDNGPMVDNSSRDVEPALPSFNTNLIVGSPLPVGVKSIEREDTAWLTPEEQKDTSWLHPDETFYANQDTQKAANRKAGTPQRGRLNRSGKYLNNEQFDIQSANQFLTLTGTQFDKDAQTLLKQIASDPNLSRNLTQNITERLSGLIDRYTKTAPNEIAATNFKSRATEQALQIAAYSRRMERGKAISQYGQSIKSQVDLLADKVYRDPAQEAKALQDLRNSGLAAAKSGLSRTDLQEFLFNAPKRILKASISGLIATNPELAIKRLESGELAGKLLYNDREKLHRSALNALAGQNKQIAGSFENRITKIAKGAYTDFNPENEQNYYPEIRGKVKQYNEYLSYAATIRQTPTAQLSQLAELSNNPNIQDLAAKAVVERRKNPLDYAYRSRDVRPVILDGSVEAVKRHLLNIDSLEMMYGEPITKPLTSDYRKILSEELDSGNLQRITSAVEQLKAFGTRTDDAVKQLSAKNDHIQAFLFAPDKTTLARIVTGMNVKTDKDSSAYNSSDGTALIKEQFGPYFMKDAPGALQAMHFSTIGLQTSEGNTHSYQDSLQKATGVATLKQNSTGFWSGPSYTTLLPTINTTAEEFDTQIKSMRNQDFAKYSNKVADNNPTWSGAFASNRRQVDFSDISPDSFKYIPTSPGKYAVLLDDKPLRTSSGDVYTVDFKALMGDDD